MKHLASFIFILIFLPINAQLYFEPRGVGGGGALFSPSINPADNNEYFLSCDMTELFHTTNFGFSYDQVHFSQFVGGHNSKICYTNNTSILYSISYISDVGTPVRSNDHGVTWSTLSGNPIPGDDKHTIHVNYANPNQIIISSYNNIYFSINGGLNFTSIHTAASGNGNVVAGVLFDGANIYIGTNDGVLVSTNSGVNWTIASITGIPAGERIWSFTAAKSGATTRFFCITGNSADVYVGLQGSDYWGFFQGLYTCDYGTTNWTSVENGITNNDYPMFIDMAENDINTVYIAGSNTSGVPIVMKSTNAGANWFHNFITTNNQNIITGWSGQGGDRGWGYGECPFGFDVASNNSQTVIFTDFGFCHKTNDGGSNWQQAYVNTNQQNPANTPTPPFQSYSSVGLENTTSWQVHWINPAVMWACYSDIRGLRSVDAGLEWSFNYTGNTANSSYRVVQLSNGTLLAGTSNIHDMYQSTRLQDAILDANDANGKIIYSTNNGASWQLLHLFNHPVYWIALDPNNPNRAYVSVIHYNGGAGIGGVYRCDDINLLASSTWTLLPNPPRTEKHPASLVVLDDGSLVASYSGRRNSGGAFTASSGVFIYDPGSNSWTDKSHTGMYYWTKDVVIDPSDPLQNTWYAGVFSGWGGPPNGLGGLYKTVDRGQNWTKITGSLLDRVTSCTFNPTNPDEIYLTTEAQGLWRSTNINSATPTFSLVDEYPFRQPERVFFNPYNPYQMWVTSFGNGLKVVHLPDISSIEKTDSDLTCSIFPNPGNGNFMITSKIYLQNTNIQIFNTNGQLVYTYSGLAGKQWNIESDLATGVYYIHITSEENTFNLLYIKQ